MTDATNEEIVTLIKEKLEEKNEVIKEQQIQIQELQAQIQEGERELQELKDAAAGREDLVKRLGEVLD